MTPTPEIRRYNFSGRKEIKWFMFITSAQVFVLRYLGFYPLRDTVRERGLGLNGFDFRRIGGDDVGAV